MNWTPEEYDRHIRKANMTRPARNKFGAEKTVVDGYTFDSKKEAARYTELKLLQKAGRCVLESIQPVYAIRVNGIFIGDYTADFRWTDLVSGQEIVEDVKSKASKTTAYQLRKKLVEAIYGIQIRET